MKNKIAEIYTIICIILFFLVLGFVFQKNANGYFIISYYDIEYYKEYIERIIKAVVCFTVAGVGFIALVVNLIYLKIKEK